MQCSEKLRKSFWARLDLLIDSIPLEMPDLHVEEAGEEEDVDMNISGDGKYLHGLPRSSSVLSRISDVLIDWEDQDKKNIV